MSFVSIFFAAVYLSALAWRIAVPNGSRLHALGLVVLSWTFYAWHAPYYLSLLVLTTTVDYVVARLLALHHLTPFARRALLTASVTLNVGLLVYFKYMGLIAWSFGSVAGPQLLFPILLPIGISFYTFMSISYTVDVYRGRLEPERDFIRFAAYLAFFPHLIAGPIVRGRDFLYQLRRRKKWSGTIFTHGAFLIVRGLFLKLVVADNLGLILDRLWQDAAAQDGSHPLAFSLLVFFAGQLFADFAGYTDIARGVSYQLGYRLPINFNAPYIAGTFSEFWRRWHITLSSWMRDYVYIPLGGSWHGSARALANLCLVMLVSGLWHGANWKFGVWGLLLGVAVAVERALGLARGPKSPLGAAAWYGVVQLTWIFSLAMFRADNVSQGWQVLCQAAGVLVAPTSIVSLAQENDLVQAGWWFLLPVVALHARTWLSQRWRVRPTTVFERSVYAGAMAAAILTLYTSARQFIYFRF